MKSHVKHAKHFWPGGDKSAHGGHSTFFGWGAGIDVGPPSILASPVITEVLGGH